MYSLVRKSFRVGNGRLYPRSFYLLDKNSLRRDIVGGSDKGYSISPYVCDAIHVQFEDPRYPQVKLGLVDLISGPSQWNVDSDLNVSSIDEMFNEEDKNTSKPFGNIYPTFNSFYEWDTRKLVRVSDTFIDKYLSFHEQHLTGLNRAAAEYEIATLLSEIHDFVSLMGIALTEDNWEHAETDIDKMLGELMVKTLNSFGRLRGREVSSSLTSRDVSGYYLNAYSILGDRVSRDDPKGVERFKNFFGFYKQPYYGNDGTGYSAKWDGPFILEDETSIARRKAKEESTRDH